MIISAVGFSPAESIQVVLHSVARNIATTSAASDGTLRFSFVVPADLEFGLHRLELVGQSHTQSFTFSVAATAGGAGTITTASLPFTGTNTVFLMALAGVFLEVGVLAIRLSKHVGRRESALAR